MQPYLFPYIGYFQLIHASDLFMVYDDVSYIKSGFINRNTVLSRNGLTRFTVPLSGASQNKLIASLQFEADVAKPLRTIEHSYSKAPYFDAVFPIVSKILNLEDRAISSVCINSYATIFSYLGLDKQMIKTSSLDYDRAASAQNRLISLSKRFGADCYLNLPGGRDLYAKPDFAERGIELRFIESLPIKYSQGQNGFVPNLSIIDVLMNCSPDEVCEILRMYNLG